MANEKGFGFTEEDLLDKEAAPRARNRTVMLSPEMTGAVRAKIAQGMGQTGNVPPLSGHDRGLETKSNPAPRFGDNPVQKFPYSSQVQELTYQNESVPSEPYNSSGASVTNPSINHSEIGSHSAVATHREANSWSSSTRYEKQSRIAGFLVSFDQNPNGEVFELRVGRLIVTSDKTTPGSILYLSDATVSSSHAILRISSSGEMQVLDQLSEYGTRIRASAQESVIELSGEKWTLRHGDILQFGERSFHICMISSDNSE